MQVNYNSFEWTVSRTMADFKRLNETLLQVKRRFKCDSLNIWCYLWYHIMVSYYGGVDMSGSDTQAASAFAVAHSPPKCVGGAQRQISSAFLGQRQNNFEKKEISLNKLLGF